MAADPLTLHEYDFPSYEDAYNFLLTIQHVVPGGLVGGIDKSNTLSIAITQSAKCSIDRLYSSLPLATQSTEYKEELTGQTSATVANALQILRSAASAPRITTAVRLAHAVRQALLDKYRYERIAYISHPVIDIILGALDESYDVAEGSDVYALADQTYIALFFSGALLNFQPLTSTWKGVL